jgi:tetratricopeptide (TPR) repeat protein
MARAAVKAKQAQRAKAAPPKQRQPGRRRHASGGNPNQDLFFIRIRRKQRWVFAALAVLFALTFAFLGVGSGSGSGLDQLFNNINIFGGSHGPSVSKAQKEIQKHPTSAKGYRDLATAFEAKGDTGQAITALQQYTGMKPKDAAAWSELAGLQSTQANGFLNDYTNAYTALQEAAPSQSFVPTGKLAPAFSNPIETAQQSSVQASVNDLQQKVSLAENGAVGSWQHVTGLQPKNLNAWFQLAQAAQSAGNTTAAVSAYKRYLKLDPNSTSAPQIRALIKQLSPAPPKKKK